LIEIPEDKAKELLEQYDRPDLFLFGSTEDDTMCWKIHAKIGCPELKAKHGWKLFGTMVNYYLRHEEELYHSDSDE